MGESQRRRVLTMRTAKIAVPTVAALGVSGAIAVAAIPGSDGTIAACYKGNKGDLRVVDSAADCKRDETALTWNQKGVQGDKGDKGEPGAQGPAGAAGGGDALVIGGEALQGGRAQGFLKLDGVSGESNDSKHAGEIDLKAFSFGVTNTASSSSGGGGGTGKASFSSFHIAKLFDSSSPKLFAFTANGQHIKTATISFRRPGAGQQDFLTYKFSDVVVDGYKQGGTKEPPLLEDVSMDFSKVEVSYTPQNPDGSAGTPIQAGWDVKNAKGA